MSSVDSMETSMKTFLDWAVQYHQIRLEIKNVYSDNEATYCSDVVEFIE